MPIIPRGWLRRLFGNRGEHAAARFLKRKGYKILARQMRNRQGEIDLIALDQGVFVFVEVKTRSSHAKGHPAEAVDYTKQKQITQAALAWMKRRKVLHRSGRFDVVAVTWPSHSEPVIDHYKSAFPAVGRGQFYS
ncbi:MAG TPA: YraN family protein [Planctomicrobium sp.]|nr:YraN family protein [Planctomicrobium sp.]